MCGACESNLTEGRVHEKDELEDTRKTQLLWLYTRRMTAAAARGAPARRARRSTLATGHRSGCAHAEVFRKPGTTMFWRLVYDLLPSGEWWDTIPADSVSDRWGARKFTIGQRGAVKGPAPSSLTNPAAAARPRRAREGVSAEMLDTQLWGDRHPCAAEGDWRRYEERERQVLGPAEGDGPI